ncbi:hypothetical protein [Streptomyces sp. NPDC046862]|uniref:hypothetical protein n=1 Tax=Streptomyces sp. NPDC046862 TaxID=3154603 RepID=UPI0034521B1E
MEDGLDQGLVRTGRHGRLSAAATMGSRGQRPARPSRPGQQVLHQAMSAAAVLVVVLLLLMVVRLPWAGDLGMHAAVLERLHADPQHPGNPLVDADTPSPYYSPWMVALWLVAEATDWSTFQVLHFSALVNLLLLLTGIRGFVRTFTLQRSAVPCAMLCVTLLYGVGLFAWSGFPSLTSLSLTLAYPSTFAFGLSFHLWALLRTAVADAWPLPAFLALGLLLALILLAHQFTGGVAILGAAGVLLGARPWPKSGIWLRVGTAAAAAAVVLAVWPYYPFFSLFTVGGLEGVHRPLYQDLFERFCLVSVGVAALAARWWKDRRDPLVIFFLLGLAVFTVGGLTGRYSWGRTLPAVLVPAQVALALEAVGAGRRVVARLLAPLAAAALLIGAWAQAGVLAYVLRTDAIPPALRAAPRFTPWHAIDQLIRPVPTGQTVMTNDYYALRMIPAYGPYTVAPAYPDVFLADAEARRKATDRYFAPGTPRQDRLAILRDYGVSWVVQKSGHPGGLLVDDPALEEVARGRYGLVLLRVKHR